jgi:hypothetical protein
MSHNTFHMLRRVSELFIYKAQRSVSQTKPTYWVRSKQLNETGEFGGRPVPAKFKTLEEAELYRRHLNLHRGPYHPGYVAEVQEDSPPPFTAGTEGL